MDNDLAGIGRLAIGQREFGLSEAQSQRLRGGTADEVRADAKAMRKELGLDRPADLPRDRRGKYARHGGIYDKRSPNDFNQIIRQAAGRE